MMVLKLLEQEDMYGYQMIETLRERSEHSFDLKAGTLYPLLHALEQKGLITARDEASAVVIKINGSILYSKSVAPDKSIVSVSYVGQIESSQITVDGEPYDNYTIS